MRLLAHAHDQCFVCFDQRKTTLIFWLQNRVSVAFRSQYYNPYCSKKHEGSWSKYLDTFFISYLLVGVGKNRQQNDAANNKHMVNSVSSKNSTLSNLEENLFSMMDENTSLLSETTTRQRTAEHQVNDEIISEAVTGDGAKTAIECVTADVHRRVSPSVEKKRGEVKAAVAEKRPKQVLT